FDTLSDFMSHCPGMLFSAAPSGALLRLSEPLKRLLGAAARVGAALGEFIHPDDRGAFDGTWATVVQGREPVEINVRLRDADGSYRSLLMHARRSPARGEIFGDIQDRAPGAERDSKVLRVLLDTIPIRVFILDLQGTFIFNEGNATPAVGSK